MPNSNSVHVDEARRMETLRQLAVLDTPPEPVFEAITATASQAIGMPIALVSLIDSERQWFKSNVGLPGVTQTARCLAFCDHAIRDDKLFEVPDATQDPRFADNALVTGAPHIRFYAGAPIVMPNGVRIGTVCVIDRQPRQLTDMQRSLLMGLSRATSACLSGRAELTTLTRQLMDSEARYRAIVEDQTELISLAQHDGTLTFVNAAYARFFDVAPADMVGRNLLQFVHAVDREPVLAQLHRTWADREAFSSVNRMMAQDGSTRWVAWTNRPLLNGQGEITAIQSVGRDITEQELAKLALAENERRHRHSYEATPAMLHSIDAQGRIINVSDLWLQVLGYERNEVVGRASIEFLTPEGQEKARTQVLPAFFKSGRCDNVEYQFVRKDGARIDVLLSAVAERDAQGHPFRSLAVLEDVTEKRRMALELGRTHAHLNAIVDNVPATLGYWDRAGMTRFANREFQSSTGLPLAEIIGQPLAGIYESVDATGWAVLAPHVQQVLAGQRQEFECALLTTSGLRQLRMTLIPDQSIPGEVAGFYGMGYDITGRKALELRLTDSEARYRSLFDHLNSGFALHEVVVDTEGHAVNYTFLAMNAAYAGMTGIDPHHAVGRLVTEVLPALKDDAVNWIEVFGRVATTGAPIHFEQHSQALQRTFDVVAYRPAPGQFAVISHDITQRKDAERELALGEQRLRLLVDAVQDHSVCLLDSQGYIKTWSAGAQAIKGYMAQDIIGQHYRKFFGSDDVQRGEPERQLALSAQAGTVTSEGWRYRKNGTRFWAIVSINAVRDARGELQGFVKVTKEAPEREPGRALGQRVAEIAGQKASQR